MATGSADSTSIGDFPEPLSRLATGFVETWESERVGHETKAVRSFEMNAKSMLTKPLLCAGEPFDHMDAAPAGDVAGQGPQRLVGVARSAIQRADLLD